MSKLLLVTDTHLGLYQSSDFYHDIVYSLFKEIKQTMIERDIRTAIHLGDFFHEKKALNSKTQWVAHKIADLFEDPNWNLSGTDISLYIITGNHDIYFKEKLEPTALDVFKNYNSIIVIDEITEIKDGIIMVPWGLNPTGFRSGYCFGHFAFIGFKMNNNYLAEVGFDSEDKMWNNFDHVYSGHFHWPSNKGKITYLGSAYPQNFNDVDSPRGYYIWEDGELEFIEFKKAPKYVKVKTDNINKDDIKGNIIKLIFTEDYGSIQNQQIIDEILSYGPIKFQSDFSQAKLEGADERLETMDASLLDHPEIIKSYLDKIEIPKNLNKKTILTMMSKLSVKGEE